jgi:hypothetical protein
MTHINLTDYGTFYAVYPHRDSPLKTRVFMGVIKEIIGEKTPIWESHIPGFEKMCGN